MKTSQPKPVFQFVPDAELAARWREQHAIINRIVRVNLELENKWLDDVMSRELPEKIYRWGHSKVPFFMRKASEYLRDEAYVIRRFASTPTVEITKRGVVIASYEPPKLNFK